MPCRYAGHGPNPYTMIRPHLAPVCMTLLSVRPFSQGTVAAEVLLCLCLQLGDNSTAAAEKGAVEEVQRAEKRVGHLENILNCVPCLLLSYRLQHVLNLNHVFSSSTTAG